MADNEASETHPNEREWVVVDEVDGPMQAEILRGLLEAQGLMVSLAMEGVGRVHGLFVGPLANNQVLVPNDQVEAARKVLEEYYSGAYEQVDLLDTGDSTDDNDENQEPSAAE